MNMMKKKIEEAVDMFLRDRWADYDTIYEYKLDSIYSFKISGDICNPRSHEVPHIVIDFTQNISGLVTNLNNHFVFTRSFLDDINIRKTLIDGLYGQYQRLYKMEDGVEIGVNLYRSVLNDNDKLRKENESLKKQLQEEKAAHIVTKNRVIFAGHILSGNRDERVKEFSNQGYSYPVNF